MSRSDRILADADAVLQRSSERYRGLNARAKERQRRDVGRRAKRVAIAAVLVLAGAMVAGFIHPLGETGLLLVIGLLMATLVLGFISTEAKVEPEKLAKADLKQLPLQTEIWLENQRKALPAPALSVADSIGAKLEVLAPQLQALPDNGVAAEEIRRLLSDHLPELVTGYQSIPEPMRRQERNGRVPEQQLVEGLKVIDEEIRQISENLAAGDLDKLATQNRFLELKYQEAKELGQ